MPLIKTFLKNSQTQTALSWLLASFIRLVFISNQKTLDIHDTAKAYMQGGNNALFSFWHGRMMLLPAICPKERPMHVLISNHRDGRLISRIIGYFGQDTISGSSSKGGQGAVAEILRSLENGDNISITPDGPRGPAQIAAKGIVTLARLSGKPILPVTFSATRCRRFSSWDSFMVALPFGRIVFCVGEPIWVSESDDEEAVRVHVEQAMNALVDKADKVTHV